MINKIELHNIFSKLREGDNSQFELLYKNYNQLVYKISFSILKNKENSEDIKQIVFLKIWEINKEVFLWKKKRMKLFYLKIKE
mgnify:CR=1 FL=1